MARPGARALQARMELISKDLAFTVSIKRACKARAPSHSTVFLFRKV
jgi:hypothetical protein